jgi:hypothetical protein
MLIQLIYRSKVSRHVRLSDAEKIAEGASPRNASADISGLLLYTPTHFIQVLEGDEPVVRKLFSKIERDERHHQVEVIADRPLTERQFGEWAMRIGMPRKETSAATLAALDETAALNLLLDAIASSNS